MPQQAGLALPKVVVSKELTRFDPRKAPLFREFCSVPKYIRWRLAQPISLPDIRQCGSGIGMAGKVL